ncbi:DUF4190 domain-containing protein [Desertihabitans brevis]|uniref:DUF4190 domain-containing protein n=1 Tax=Desertihabitans brevis TaxID=2268447 RepID=A0A367YZ58_9ACTN|nr:DUF4190 domain-containing protein [Desertihabitans brevis]RCK71140.1 DUF4190 domain-containing protein [Desertihabitans brevis]
MSNPYGAPGHAYGSPPPTAENPGKTLGVVGLVLAIVAAPIGLILSIVALVQSRRAGMGNGLAVAGIVVGALFTIGIIIAIVGSVLLFNAGMDQVCSQLGPGTHDLDGTPITCPA